MMSYEMATYTRKNISIETNVSILSYIDKLNDGGYDDD